LRYLIDFLVEYMPFSFSNFPAAASAVVASWGKLVNTTEAIIVRGRSAPWSSSGMGASSGIVDWLEDAISLAVGRIIVSRLTVVD
jgi:hypothetical protein